MFGCHGAFDEQHGCLEVMVHLMSNMVTWLSGCRGTFDELHGCRGTLDELHGCHGTFDEQHGNMVVWLSWYI